jgi:hypothetical protein
MVVERRVIGRRPVGDAGEVEDVVALVQRALEQREHVTSRSAEAEVLREDLQAGSFEGAMDHLAPLAQVEARRAQEDGGSAHAGSLEFESI